MSVKVTRDETAKLQKALAALSRSQVLVGIPSSTAGRKADDSGEISNAVIGYLMETGSPAGNIPERPHLRPGVADAKDAIIARYRAGGKAVLDGRAASLDPTHHTVGLIAQASVRAKITNGTFEPLAASTLAARRRRGRTGDKPLIDTGQYRNSISYVVRPKD